MLQKWTARIRRLFGIAQHEPRVVRISVSEQRVREMMQGDKDFRIRVDFKGSVTACCNACNCALKTNEGNGLLWFRCPGCERVSFYPMGNIQRDTHFAIQDGAPLEYDLYYLREIPPGLRPPE